ncbi:pentatricopeptide repeat-containing protein At4g14820-like [Selaginella moellendorffii]|uniref:pentatricopeptide repeat-containing protein At4g14820-like n=1 Tax=Selaginella moellendorffii TaxID=88036 RepID=UPI000D1CDEB6|nr:pentatricopeptide repeat-containing protein At4g14820-like [Selaginella moellendorffii]|eukprot:XP_024523648.1 pentatricopeptide repeat-containing protein At4g14820-like [Selaginella moellendorffii]
MSAGASRGSGILPCSSRFEAVLPEIDCQCLLKHQVLVIVQADPLAVGACCSALSSRFECGELTCHCLRQVWRSRGSQEGFSENPRQERCVLDGHLMLTAYTFYGNGSKALEVYDKMVGQLIQPDSMVLLNVIDAESLVRDVGLVRNLHACVASSSFILKIQIQNALINMYAQCGSLEEARQVFDGTERKNLVSWNVMVGSYVQHRYDEEVIALFLDMKAGNSRTMESGFRSLVSASSDSSLYTKSVKSSDSTNTLASSISDSILNPNCIMAVILLCAGLGKLAEGQHIHTELCAANPEILEGSMTNVTLGNVLQQHGRCCHCRPPHESPRHGDVEFPFGGIHPPRPR